MNRIVAVGVLALAMASAGLRAEDTSSVLVKQGKVVEQTVTETLTAYGRIQPDPDQVLSLSLPHGGLVSRVWVGLGQRVVHGDKLLELTTSPGAHMRFLQAQSAVDYARQELARQKRLRREQLATGAQVDAAHKALRDALATLDALRQRGLDKGQETLVAPMDGIVTRIDVQQGQRIPADTTAVLIAAKHRLVAQLGVEPEDLGRIKSGAPVRLTSVFVPDCKVTTRVREVHAMINPATHLVDVLAPIPAGQVEYLILGSRMLAQIQLSAHKGLTVPHSAVLQDERGAYVFTIADARAKRVDVTTGAEQDGGIEVSGDLKAGEAVVISGNYELTDGVAVRELKQ